MQGRRVEDRDARIARADEHRNFGAAENDALGTARDERRDDTSVGGP
jgi:hypothetical protein